MSEIVEWFSINNLLLNESKTKLVKFSVSDSKLIDTNVMVKNYALDIVETTLFLGLTLDSKYGYSYYEISKNTCFCSKCSQKNSRHEGSPPISSIVKAARRTGEGVRFIASEERRRPNERRMAETRSYDGRAALN
ncbi:hypothetical protein EVAR_33047_1 [Eumeta japonica]|uniref:Uncharacterized protein n=1 Tax=Eumeta variegata TaxID=151549 RepID=A0A4C1WT80_EUMVA|nr:hypothetical protein EVAR_33047_1 [Eumeta japonica]